MNERHRRIYTWILNHPGRASWIALELFMRPLSLRQRLSNAWWQWKHYGDVDAFEALWQTWSRSWKPEAVSSEAESPTSRAG